MRRWAVIPLASAILFAFAANAQVLEMYRWTDAEGVVHYTNGLRDIPEQFRGTATLIRSAEARPVPPPVDKASIQFQRRGDLVVVKATLNGKLPVSFVVDTGASYTTISQAAAQAAGIQMPENPTVLSFHTANGTIQAPLGSLRSMEIGGLELKDVTVAIHDVFPDAAIAGLLGQNFLSQFRLEIDGGSGLLNLYRK
jgi:clan AA aspartic protease (TIGR02281 family)